MKQLIYILALITPVSCFAQKTETKEEFVNSVYKVFVNKSFSKYLLYVRCSKVSLLKAKNLKEAFGSDCPGSICQEMDLAIKNDTVNETWNCSVLNKAECVDNISIDTIFLEGQSFSSNPNDKEVAKEEMQREKQREKNNKKPQEEQAVYFFSKPLVSNGRQYAVISMRFVCGGTCGMECLYLFKNESGNWLKIANRCIDF